MRTTASRRIVLLVLPYMTACQLVSGLSAFGTGRPAAGAGGATASATVSTSATGGSGGSSVSSGGSSGCVHYVFVTYNFFSGDLGGLVGADAQCQPILPFAGLWQAVLSDGKNHARDRIAVAGDVYLANDGDNSPRDTRVATRTQFWSEKHEKPIDREQHGGMVPTETLVWTGTQPDGTSSVFNCVKWANSSSLLYGGMGHANLTDASWIQVATGEAPEKKCDQPKRLYCISSCVDPSSVVM